MRKEREQREQIVEIKTINKLIRRAEKAPRVRRTERGWVLSDRRLREQIINTINHLIGCVENIKKSMLIIVDIMADLHDRVTKLESERNASDADDVR